MISRKLFDRLDWNASLVIGLLIRLALILFGEWQDRSFYLKYTDVDYDVFLDSAAFVNQGMSPFERGTYRYTPLLSWIMIPSVLYRSFGKIVFVLADLLVSILLRRISLTIDGNELRAKYSGWMWLLNPITMNISTRGSADSLICLLVLSTLYLTILSRECKSIRLKLLLLSISGLLHGFSIHFKLFPIVHSLCYVIFILNLAQFKLKSLASSNFIQACVFIIFCLLSSCLITYYFIQQDGLFLQHGLLYHITRHDHRHNFSPYFLFYYLNPSFNSSVGFVLQCSLIFATSMLANRNLIKSLLVSTMIFIAFNKVSTAQYFLWFGVYFPLIQYNSALVKPMVIWTASILVWLVAAHELELSGKNWFLAVWGASLFHLLTYANLLVGLLKEL